MNDRIWGERLCTRSVLPTAGLPTHAPARYAPERWAPAVVEEQTCH